MESVPLKKARRQLALRLVTFTTGLIIIFSLQTHNQLQEDKKQAQQRQLLLLGLMALTRLPEITSSDNSGYAKTERLRLTGAPEGSSLSGTWESDIRILWLSPSMNLLDEYGSFVPGGSLVPPPKQRLKNQAIHLTNGVGLWLPATLRSSPNGSSRIQGFVAIASPDESSDHSSAISLLSATAASLALALLGIPWILERSLQPLREQINRLSQFTGDVAHELRNPMMALKTSLAATRDLLSTQPGDAIRQRFNQLDVITTRMATILNDVLLLAQIENGNPESEDIDIAISISDIFDELAVLHDSEARAKSIDLNFLIHTPFSLTVTPSRIQRILSNLISNAIRFSYEGSKVSIAALREGDKAVIRVDDAGPGIPANEQKRVFERFVQLESHHEIAHSGIGLALSRSLAELHGGSLEVQQSPAGGCRMALKLPLRSANQLSNSMPIRIPE